MFMAFCEECFGANDDTRKALQAACRTTLPLEGRGRAGFELGSGNRPLNGSAPLRHRLREDGVEWVWKAPRHGPTCAAKGGNSTEPNIE